MRKNFVSDWIRYHEKDVLSFDDYDRFGTVLKLRDKIYGILMRSPLHSADSWGYLVLGDEKALLIDTGFGIGDLKKVVTGLAGGRPLMVLNTHCHIDHTLGNNQFEEVHINIRGTESLLRENFISYQKRSGRPITDHSFYQDSDVCAVKEYSIVGIPDYYEFDLGGCPFTAYALTGHSQDGMAFIDHRDRVLFSGDAIMYPFPTPIRYTYQIGIPYPERRTVTSFYKDLKVFAPHVGEFDCLFDGHGIPGGPSCIVTDMLYCAQDVVMAPDTGYETHMIQLGEIRRKHCGGAAIDYLPERV